MKTNHVLIDYENVQPEVSEALSQPIFKVWVFVGAQQSKVKFDLLELVQRKGPDIKVIKMTTTGRNALDFHMSCYLGKLWSQEPDAYFHLIAKDTGMDTLVEHLKEQGVHVARWQDVRDIPIIKTPANDTEDAKLSRIVECLIGRGSQRPASLKTLKGTVAALFQPKLAEAQASALVDELRIAEVFEIVGTKIKYGLPD